MTTSDTWVYIKLYKPEQLRSIGEHLHLSIRDQMMTEDQWSGIWILSPAEMIDGTRIPMLNVRSRSTGVTCCSTIDYLRMSIS